METTKTRFTKEETTKLQEKFVSEFYKQVDQTAKPLTKEEFRAIVKKHLSHDFLNA